MLRNAGPLEPDPIIEVYTAHPFDNQTDGAQGRYCIAFLVGSLAQRLERLVRQLEER